MMKKRTLSAVVSICLASCTSKVEIPAHHVGVISDDQQVNPTVLSSGEYVVEQGSRVIVFDLRPTRLDLDIDFLLSDASEGRIRMAIKFRPIADSLPALYRRYRSIHVEPIVEQGIKRVTRELLAKYAPTESFDTLRRQVKNFLIDAPTLGNYVVISDIDIVELRY